MAALFNYEYQCRGCGRILMHGEFLTCNSCMKQLIIDITTQGWICPTCHHKCTTGMCIPCFFAKVNKEPSPMPSPTPLSTKRTIYEWEIKLSSRKAKLTYTNIDGFNLKIHGDDPENYLITRADLSLLSTMLMEAYVDLAPAPPQP